MEKSQPTFIPPMARIPQVPPQQIAGNRRVYVSPRISRPAAPRFVVPSRPVSSQEISSGQDMADRLWPAQPLMLPQTPRPQQISFNTPVRKAAAASAKTQHVTAVPRTPPLRIPATPHHRLHRAGPSAGEILLGCALLLLMSVLALAIMYLLLA